MTNTQHTVDHSEKVEKKSGSDPSEGKLDSPSDAHAHRNADGEAMKVAFAANDNIWRSEQNN